MSVLSAITAMLMAIATTTTDAGFATPAFLSTPQSAAQSIQSSSSTSSCLMAYRERTNYDQKGARSTVKNSRKRRDDSDLDNDNDYNGSGRGYDDFEDDFDQPYTSQKKSPQPSASQSQSNNKSNNSNSAETTAPAQASTFYSQKSLTDPSFSSETQFFQQLCNSANIHRPSRIQSLAWPPLLRGENCIVADQTGSGKTLAYLLPLLQKLHASDKQDEVNGMKATEKKKKRTGAPRVVILTPTAELADQIFKVCASLGKNLAQSSGSEWTFNPFVTTATGSHSTNIRDQIRLLQSTPVDVLVSTPGRLSTILRTKNVGLDLGHVQSLVLDEVDFLLVDETFGPQLRTVGVAVQGGENAKDGSGAQFIFVTATLPEDVLASIQTEFENVTQLRGPGLHRITPTVAQTLVDVSVPPTSNKDKNACFDIKMREMFKALRGKRVNKTLIFCNTVETCRSVENVLRRKDRKGRRNRVWAYHNALSPEVRLKNLNSFSSSVGDEDITESILVCTDRAARGIDFDASPIDHVVLFDFPKDPAEYVRRVGRTARAGRAGASTVLAYGWQLPVARQIMGLSGGTKKGKGKRGDAKLAAFNMMKSGDGWDDDEKEDEYYVKGGARKRKEVVAGGVDTKKKKPKRKKGDKAKPWKEVNQ